MLTIEQQNDIADRVVYDLMTADDGRRAWQTAELIEGIAAPAEFEPRDLRAVVRIMGRWHDVPANLVNSVYFRAGNGQVTTPDGARKYLQRPGRPAAGLRVQDESDDPFAIQAKTEATARAAAALPRNLRRLADDVEAGRVSETARDAITATAATRRAEALTPELAAQMRRMLPEAG